MKKIKVLVSEENLVKAKELNISLSHGLNAIIEIQEVLNEELSTEKKDEIINKIRTVQNSVKKITNFN